LYRLRIALRHVPGVNGAAITAADCRSERTANEPDNATPDYATKETEMSGSLTSAQLSTQLDTLQDQMNAKELSMYTYAAKSSFNQSMAQTLGELATNAAKAKPQV
jgi:hypothetical protein